MAKPISAQTYHNPVYTKSFPDPFVLKYRGEYYAYCTDFWQNGKVFGVLHSKDLINWKEIGGAMLPLESNPPFYWAPEVTYANGKFYLYYSVGNEILMELRVAVSDQPDRGFVDSGKRLTIEDFAIDAHLFTDDNGKKYLFYATDFLEHTHIGTGTVVDRMIDFFTLEGKPRPVTRAKYDWQIYDPQRKEKGGIRWHTVEGSFVLKRKDVYYEMFSGGNWQNITYGVSFAITDDIERNEEWEQFSDGEKVFPILRTIPGLVTGPGHNSVIRGLNNRELFCIYHRWTENGRALAIDRMDFAGDSRIFILGATTSSQPAPYKPAILDFFDNLSDKNWKIISGNWFVKENQIICEVSESSEIECQFEGKSYLFEISLRSIEDKKGKFGIYLKHNKINIGNVLLDSNKKILQINWLAEGKLQTEEFNLPNDFDFESFHLLRVEIDNFLLKVSLDEQLIILQKNISHTPVSLSLAAENCRAAFSGATLTSGFENLFEKDDLEIRGWKIVGDSKTQEIKNKNLLITNQGGNETIFEKDFSADNYELTFNLCLLENFNEEYRFGFGLRSNGEKQISFTFFEKPNLDWYLQIEKQKEKSQIPLPQAFSPNKFLQFTLLRESDKIILRLETENLKEIDFPEMSNKVFFFAQNVSIAFDMIRLTSL